MKVRELIEQLQKLTEAQKDLPVYVEDGLDPDPFEADSIEHLQADRYVQTERIEIRS